MGHNNKRFLHWAIIFSVALLSLTTAFLLTTGALTAHADEPLEQYGRNGLDVLDGDTDNLVGVYDLLVAGVNAKSAEISTTSIPVEVGNVGKIMEALRNDHPEFYYLSGGFSYSSYVESSVSYLYSVLPVYIDALTDDASAALFEAGIQEVMTDAHLRPGMDVVEKERALHDALCRKVTYELYAPNAHSAYGALVDGEAVCEGYARAFQLLLNRVGISSHVVTGDANNGTGTEAHAWNLVKIGSYYCYTDVTWDDQTTPDNQYDNIYYGYFNLSDHMISEDHSAGIDYAALPDTSDTTQDYSIFYSDRYSHRLGLVVEQWSISDLMVEEVAELLRVNGVARIYVREGEKSTVAGNLWTWYEAHVGSIVSNLGVSGLAYSYGYSCSGREVHLKLSFVEDEKTLESKLTGVQGILSGDLSVSFFASAAPQHENDLRLRVFYNGQETVLAPTSVEDRTCTFRFDGIAPHRMGDRLDVELFVYENNGKVQTAIDGTNGFTFKDYCNELLGKTATELEISDAKKTALDQLVKDLLVYGGACQTYTGYDTAHSVGAGVTGSSFVELSTAIRSDADSTDSTIAKDAYSVWFDCANKIMMYYRADDPTGVKAYVDGKEVTPTFDGSYYLVMTDAVLATQLDSPHTFELRKGDATVQTLQFSVQAYVYALQNHTNETYRNLVRTLYNYGKSCIAYKSAS